MQKSKKVLYCVPVLNFLSFTKLLYIFMYHMEGSKKRSRYEKVVRDKDEALLVPQGEIEDQTDSDHV